MVDEMRLTLHGLNEKYILDFEYQMEASSMQYMLMRRWLCSWAEATLFRPRK